MNKLINLQTIFNTFQTNLTIFFSELAIKNASKALYHYLCQNIVGTEEHVKPLRLMNKIRDNIQSNNTCTLITSESFGEELEMRGSDLDIMVVWKQIEVCESPHFDFNAGKIHFTIELEDTQPGVT